jgi:Skp family chaperone for outer membrane proteins
MDNYQENQVQDNCPDLEKEEKTCSAKKCKCGCKVSIACHIVTLAAVIVLFILHFTGCKKPSSAAAVNVTPGNGDIVYVNIDSINTGYEMVSLLTDSIEAEKQKQSILFQNRQKALETKLANYQRNVQTGQLTAQQAQYAEASLQQESQTLQNDYAQAVESLEARYTAAMSQIADSLKAAAQRVNAKYNASFVFSYGNGGQMICADPTKDITAEVLDELNKPFKKKKK